MYRESQKFDAEAYLQFETKNVGNRHVVNPTYYKKLLRAVLENPKKRVSIVDAGGGAGNMAREILYSDPKTIPALLKTNRSLIAKARKKIGKIIVLDDSAASLEWGKLLLEEILDDKKIKNNTVEFQQCDLGDESRSYPIDTGDADIVTSRQFMMYLTNSGLEHFSEESSRMTDKHGILINSFLNPDYQAKKYREDYPDKGELHSGEAFDYPTQVDGKTTTFTHHFRTLGEILTTMQRTGAKVEECLALMPNTDVFRKSHERYYGPDPMAYLLEMRKTPRDQTEELIN